MYSVAGLQEGMKIRAVSRRTGMLPSTLLLLFCLIFQIFPTAQVLAEKKSADSPPAVNSLPDMVMWEEAMALLEKGEGGKAGAVLLKLRELYPESAVAEDALWRAAQIFKAEAFSAEKPDWDGVRAVFKRFSSDYPDSSHAQEAYLEIGITQYRMRYFREALVYLNLFFKKFPDSPLMDEAIFWKVKTLFAVGREAEAKQLLEKFPDDAERSLRIKVAGLYFESGWYKKIFSVYDQLKKEIVPYSTDDLYFLHLRGLSHLRSGEEKKGRDFLYTYYNVAEKSAEIGRAHV